MSNCRSCGKEIAWVKMKSGKMNPVELKYYAVVTDAGEVVRGRESHYSHCPQAGKWRKDRDNGRDDTTGQK